MQQESLSSSSSSRSSNRSLTPPSLFCTMRQQWVFLVAVVAMMCFVVPMAAIEAFVPSASSSGSIEARTSRVSRTTTCLASNNNQSAKNEDEDEGEQAKAVMAAVAPPERKTKKPQLSRPERKALERQKKLEQERAKRRKPSAAAVASSSSSPYSLHSKAVSHLTEKSTADDVTRAIKRAQNNHDHHDLKVVADFLINECDVGFAYGYRGSLLARLTVAALHFGNQQVARRAIDIRRLGT